MGWFDYHGQQQGIGMAYLNRQGIDDDVRQRPRGDGVEMSCADVQPEGILPL